MNERGRCIQGNMASPGTLLGRCSFPLTRSTSNPSASSAASATRRKNYPSGCWPLLCNSSADSAKSRRPTHGSRRALPSVWNISRTSSAWLRGRDLLATVGSRSPLMSPVLNVVALYPPSSFLRRQRRQQSPNFVPYRLILCHTVRNACRTSK